MNSKKVIKNTIKEIPLEIKDDNSTNKNKVKPTSNEKVKPEIKKQAKEDKKENSTVLNKNIPPLNKQVSKEKVTNNSPKHQEYLNKIGVEKLSTHSNKVSTTNKKSPDAKEIPIKGKENHQGGSTIKTNKGKPISKSNIVAKEDPNQVKIREENAKKFERYIEDSGLSIAFQLVFSELITKHIHPDNYFTYTAMRVRQIGKDIDEMKLKNN
jgi:hypothetical protein